MASALGDPNGAFGKTSLIGVGVIFAAFVMRFLWSLFQVRSRMLHLRSQGLPMPPYNPIFGHLTFCNKVLSKLPKDSNPHYLGDQIRKITPGLGPNFYLDMWPFVPIMLVLSSTETLHQVTQEHSLPKFHALREFLRPIADGLDIVTMEGQTWKKWRGIFNPGFSNKHLTTLVPDIMEEISVFCDILEKRCQSDEIFTLKKLTDNLTMDVIGKVVLNLCLHSQTTRNVMVDALIRQVRSLSFGNYNPLVKYNPVRKIFQWYNSYQMDEYLSPELDSRFELFHNGGERPSKSVIDLALQTYIENDPSTKATSGIDPIFKKLALSQVKQFIFSGHDTTSSSICYVLYLVSIHPGVLQRLREEHAATFGSGVAQKKAMLEEKPYLLNQIPFTLAVIKESLRLFPPVSSTREGEAGFSVRDTDGHSFPTDGCLVWAISHAIHRDSTYWSHPDEFIPERWLVTSENPLYPVAGAWRPFEFGPRNCIAQELATIELKLVLILSLQTVDFQPVYDEIDKGGSPSGPNRVAGERAYQIQRGQPSGDFPCRVKARVKQ